MTIMALASMLQLPKYLLSGAHSLSLHNDRPHTYTQRHTTNKNSHYSLTTTEKQA